jgi:hypothetical protein
MADELKVEAVGLERHEEWDALVARSAQHSLFSTVAWLDALAEASGEEAVLVGCVRGGALVGGVGLHVRRACGFRAARTHPLTPFGGLVLAAVDGAGRTLHEAELHAVSSALGRYLGRFDHVRLLHAPELVDVRPLQWDGWRVDVRYTLLVDLRGGESAALARMGKSLRKQARRAERAGYAAAVAGDEASLAEFGRQHEAVYLRQGLRAPLAAEALAAWCRRLLGGGHGALYCARDPEGRFATGTLVVWDRRRAYWLLGATDPERRGAGANALLHLTMVRELSGRFEEVDAVGANTPHVASYKRAYHGTLAPYYATERTPSRLFRAASWARALWWRVRARRRADAAGGDQ